MFDELASITAGSRVRRESLGSNVTRLHLNSAVNTNLPTTWIAKRVPIARRAILDAEGDGLRAIAETGAIRTPLVYGIIATSTDAVLLTEDLLAAPVGADSPRPLHPEHAWRQFGTELATLHGARPHGETYGWHQDNWLGAAEQPNTPTSSWHEFVRVNRIEVQVRRAHNAGLLRGDEEDRLTAVLQAIDTVLPPCPPSALLHGDLWSGNAIMTASGTIGVIDPAVSRGDGWADIAMMRLFGGFPAVAFDAYRATIGTAEDDEEIERRIDIYQLHHLLNHVNIFGRGYADQAMAVVNRILA